MFQNILDLSQRFPLVLASGSPRRRQLLSEIGCQFTIEMHEVDETRRPDEPPFEYALRLAKEKAIAVKGASGALVLGCDTIVIINGRVLGKPGSAEEAVQMLQTLSGNRHEVCTAVAFAAENRIVTSGYDVTGVIFHSVTDQQIRDYVAAGEPMDKAGAYGIQGMGGFLVDRIEGNLDTVVGLPRKLLDQLAAALLRKP